MEIIVLLVIGWIASYLVSLKIHPLRRCPRCEGSGEHGGSVWSGSLGSCSRCKGSGRLPRLGTRIFGS
jgi:DnaJ-class molecular chaperone